MFVCADFSALDELGRAARPSRSPVCLSFQGKTVSPTRRAVGIAQVGEAIARVESARMADKENLSCVTHFTRIPDGLTQAARERDDDERVLSHHSEPNSPASPTTSSSTPLASPFEPPSVETGCPLA